MLSIHVRVFNNGIMMDELLHETPGNEMPGRHISGYFESFDGLKLRYAIFKCEAPVAKGTIVLLHGRNETIEKYYETIQELTAHGLWVATFDWRGQGGSERLLPDRRLGHVRRFRDYERDLDAFLEKVVLPDTRLPFYMVAHSLGALVALSSAPNLANRIERMVLGAPFLGLSNQGLSEKSLRRISGLACFFGFGSRASVKDRSHRSFAENVLTSDPKRFSRNRGIVETNPELELGPPTFRWLHECLKAIGRVRSSAHLTRIHVPTIILAPTADQVASYLVMEDVARRFRACRLVVIDGAQHELFQEADRYRAQAMAVVKAFIPGGSDDEDASSGAT